MSAEEGVWMVGHFDWNFIVESVYPAEIEALRVINERGYGEVHFLPFGVDASDVALGRRAAQQSTPPA